MNSKLILKVIAMVLIIIAMAELPSIAWAVWFGETGMIVYFAVPQIVSLVIAGILLILSRNRKQHNLSIKDGFITVAVLWLVATISGSMPYYLSGVIPSYTDAFFETMSGFTACGATILENIEVLPKCMLFWRAMTHYMGGMGIVVFMVAIFPLMGIGGMKMVKTETTGPTMQKIMPKIAQTAKILWGIYFGLTIIETILLSAAGLTLYDAISHSMSTIATGGFSTRNASIASFNSVYVDAIITVFMFLSGINFALYFSLIFGKVSVIRQNTELKVYTGIFVVATAIVVFSLFRNNVNTLGEALRYGSFEVAATLSTTGFANCDYMNWPMLAQMVIFLLMFSGGCAGSTAGGMKVIRMVIIVKQSIIEMKRMLRPRGIYMIKDSGAIVRKYTVLSIAGFVALYIILTIITSLVTATGGYDLLTCFSCSASTIGNVGPGFSMIGPAGNYSFFADYVKWLLSFNMLTGRLEIYPVMILFTHTLWRR
ncbi:MAG: TrkH family potassium uptake protein [Spirochaetia bacterium]|nr:TrkH family potassium uptake protein [Spirochaetia bacterium]